ncbi:hypothetical protein O181_067322 [Austropuccinia psidii MF-1]|uniref:Uncharacterized protein n=1 Tax=Austropuccinia psidii MF-1 TaxID=1389203 RepID=A0A9Q3I555_9BASI|nr:hypothetical protein [Austropuccinia psidii MF-1]
MNYRYGLWHWEILWVSSLYPLRTKLVHGFGYESQRFMGLDRFNCSLLKLFRCSQHNSFPFDLTQTYFDDSPNTRFEQHLLLPILTRTESTAHEICENVLMSPNHNLSINGIAMLPRMSVRFAVEPYHKRIFPTDRANRHRLLLSDLAVANTSSSSSGRNIGNSTVPNDWGQWHKISVLRKRDTLESHRNIRFPRAIALWYHQATSNCSSTPLKCALPKSHSLKKKLTINNTAMAHTIASFVRKMVNLSILKSFLYFVECLVLFVIHASFTKILCPFLSYAIILSHD